MRSRAPSILAALCLALAPSSSPAAASGGAGPTSRVSLDSGGIEANAGAFYPAISENGRYVAFESRASNLVPGDENETFDVFVHDRRTQATTRVSVASSGIEGDHSSHSPALSAKGRYVAFESIAGNLVPGDENEDWDVFVHDRERGTTTGVSLDPDGAPANDGSGSPSISASGRFVAFFSRASNLVPGDGNGAFDVFVRDRKQSSTTRVSVDSNGIEANGWSRVPAISASGRYVAFGSTASNLVEGDGNGASDVFVHDRKRGTTSRISVDSGGTEANGDSDAAAISASGRYVAFSSFATNLVPVAGDSLLAEKVFVHDRKTGATTRVPVAAGGSNGHHAISANGRYVALPSLATGGLLAADEQPDVVVYDRKTEASTLVPADPDGVRQNAWNGGPALSGNGRYVVFFSEASNLVSGDANGVADVFVHDLRERPN